MRWKTCMHTAKNKKSAHAKIKRERKKQQRYVLLIVLTRYRHLLMFCDGHTVHRSNMFLYFSRELTHGHNSICYHKYVAHSKKFIWWPCLNEFFFSPFRQKQVRTLQNTKLNNCVIAFFLNKKSKIIIRSNQLVLIKTDLKEVLSK